MNTIYVLILGDEKQNDEILTSQGIFRYLAQSERESEGELDQIKVLDISRVNECSKPACSGKRLGDKNIKDNQPPYEEYKTGKYRLMIT